MRRHMLALGVATALCVTGCSNDGGNGNQGAQTPAAEKAAGNKTIGAGLAQDGQFMAAAKSAGLDQTLAGPGPYTVLVPEDAAFAAAPAGTFDATPENRARVTGVLTNLILPGTVLVEDIGKAVDAGNGKATLATMGGGAVTATKEGGNVVLADAAGNKATIVKGDEQFTNGVVHRISAVLLPAEQQADGAAAPEGNATGQ